jgi:hypothetical protein
VYQITQNFGSIELQFITEPGLFNRRVVHLLFTVRSLERPFSLKLVMLVESDPGYSRKIIVNLSLLTSGTSVYECVLCEFSQ